MESNKISVIGYEYINRFYPRQSNSMTKQQQQKICNEICNFFISLNYVKSIAILKHKYD